MALFLGLAGAAAVKGREPPAVAPRVGGGARAGPHRPQVHPAWKPAGLKHRVEKDIHIFPSRRGPWGRGWGLPMGQKSEDAQREGKVRRTKEVNEQT